MPTCRLFYMAAAAFAGALASALVPACKLCINDPNCEIASDSASSCPGDNIHLEGEACFCDAGYKFCSNDPEDLSCCPEGDEPTTGDTAEPTTGDSSEPTTGTPEPPPLDCDGKTPLQIEAGASCLYGIESEFCSNSAADDACGLQASKVYQCVPDSSRKDLGLWVDVTASGESHCRLEGLGAYRGCFTSKGQVSWLCG